MSNDFFPRSAGAESPADSAFAITPASTELAVVTRAVYVGTAGDLDVVMRDGTQITFKNVQMGSMLAIRVSKVLATSTAANIVGLY